MNSDKASHQYIQSQDKIWDYYQNEYPESFSGSTARLTFLAKKLRTKTKVLNIGVGAGTFEELALKLGLDVYSLDPSERAIASIRQRFSLGKKAQVGYSQSIPFDDNFFGTVVISEVIEHLSDEVIEKTLREIVRVLVPTGRIIGTVPACENLKEQFVICPDCGKRFHRWGHIQSFDSKRISTLLSPYFDIEELFEHPFVTWSSLNWKGKVSAIIKVFLWRFGFHSSNESIYFCGRKNELLW